MNIKTAIVAALTTAAPLRTATEGHIYLTTGYMTASDLAATVRASGISADDWTIAREVDALAAAGVVVADRRVGLANVRLTDSARDALGVARCGYAA